MIDSRRRIPVVVLVMSGAGCSQQWVDPLSAPEPPIVWPKPPDRPRLRFLGQLTGSDDVGASKSIGELWQELLYGPEPPSKLVTPGGVSVHADGQRVAVADTTIGCVHVFDLGGRIYEQKASCGDPPRPLVTPGAVAWVDDTLWVADSREHALAVFSADGTSRWLGAEALQRPAGMDYCRANGLCYVTDAAAHAVLVFDRSGELVLQFGSRGGGPGQFNFPSHIACDDRGRLVVADSLNFRVQLLERDGTFVAAFGQKGDAPGDFALPKGVDVDRDGNIWVVDAHFENVQAFTPEGDLLMVFGGEGQEPGQFWLPAGLCIDGQDRLWIADTYNRRVQVFARLP